VAAVWALARARLRGRWRPLLGLTLLVGVAAGAVMTAAIGARRTETAYPRLLKATRAEDVHVNVGGFGEEHPGFIDRLRRLPQVADMGMASVALMVPDMGPQPPRYSALDRFAAIMSADGRAGWTINRPLILSGRRPDPERPDELGLSESLARRWRVRPGDTVRLRALAPEQLVPAISGALLTPKGPAFDLKVVAIQRLPEDISLTASAEEGLISLSPAFYREHGEEIAHFPPEPHVRLVRGEADLAAFRDATRRLARDSSEVYLTTRAELTANVDQAIGAEAVALVLFAALAALAALVVIGQTLARELFLATAGHDALRALGMPRSRRFAAIMLPTGLLGVVGGMVGAGLAVLASPLMPIGLARRAEPALGLLVNLAGIGIGLLAVMVLVAACAAVPAWRLSGIQEDEPGTADRAGVSSRLADMAARAGLPPSSVTGLRMALERGRGPTAVPVRTTVIGVTAGIVALSAALTFGVSLHRLLDTPRLYGWDFDAIAGDWRLDDPASRQPSWLDGNPHVGAFSAVYFHSVLVDGAEVTVAGVDTTHGQVFPTIVEGHEPRGPDEIVLGTRTLRQLRRRLGQTVRVRVRRPTTVRIVGRSALLTGDADTAATGAILTLEGLLRADPNPGESGYGVFYVRYRPGSDPAAALHSLRRPGTGVDQDVQLPSPPIDVDNLGRVGGLPQALAWLLALLAVSALAHLLVTSVRRRRRDLAVLKTLGFVRRQVSAAVAWQATTVALIALAMGLPLGVALGRWAWSLLVDRIGLGAEPVTPWPVLLAAGLATVAVANLVAAWPGRMAAETRPAIALRSE
jgi:ABC-type lipoprotein release transport system permease subunit